MATDPRPVLKDTLKDFWRHAAVKQTMLHRLQRGPLLSVAELGRLQAETLVVWGKHDPLILPSIGRRLARAIPRAWFVELAQSAHSPMIEQADRFNRLTLAFLAE